MITTPSTASQVPAVSIADDDEFIDLMHALSSVPSSVYAGSEFSKVINYIDAKIAQARVSGVKAANDFRELVSDGDTAEIKEWKARATAAEAKLAEWEKIVEVSLAHDYATRATAAEAKMEAIRQVPTWQNRVAKSAHSDCTCLPAGIQCELMKAEIKELRALLQPQPQADESGLPG